MHRLLKLTLPNESVLLICKLSLKLINFVFGSLFTATETSSSYCGTSGWLLWDVDLDRENMHSRSGHWKFHLTRRLEEIPNLVRLGKEVDLKSVHRYGY